MNEIFKEKFIEVEKFQDEEKDTLYTILLDDEQHLTITEEEMLQLNIILNKIVKKYYKE